VIMTGRTLIAKCGLLSRGIITRPSSKRIMYRRHHVAICERPSLLLALIVTSVPSISRNNNIDLSLYTMPDLSLATLPQLRIIDRRGAATWYEAAIAFARKEEWDAARQVFKTTTELYPDLCRAWVSWAQVITSIYQRDGNDD
jgi:hypothetical protein